MKGKMQGVTLVADWAPKPGFKLGSKDIEGRQTYLGSQVWRNPRLEIREYPIPTPGPEEVLMQVKACGICGSDVHMAQADKEGYIYYPGLTGFPSILGHEFSGVVVEAGKNARDKRTNKPFKGGEAVTTEEMLWCGQCKPCADGQPNHCEQLDEVGFNVNGAYTTYIVLPSRTLWSLNRCARTTKVMISSSPAAWWSRPQWHITRSSNAAVVSTPVTGPLSWEAGRWVSPPVPSSSAPVPRR